MALPSIQSLASRSSFEAMLEGWNRSSRVAGWGIRSSIAQEFKFNSNKCTLQMLRHNGECDAR
jgi:hypothetical protein